MRISRNGAPTPLRLQAADEPTRHGIAGDARGSASASGQSAGAGASPRIQPARAGRRPRRQPAPRTHTVKAGETPSLIARKYGVKVEALMAANPKLDARRLQVGQALTIPAP